MTDTIIMPDAFNRDSIGGNPLRQFMCRAVTGAVPANADADGQIDIGIAARPARRDPAGKGRRELQSRQVVYGHLRGDPAFRVPLPAISTLMALRMAGPAARSDERISPVLHDRHRSHPHVHRIVTGVIGSSLVAGLGFGAPAPGAAQDGTGAATPTPPTACTIPSTRIDLENPPAAEATPQAGDATPVVGGTTQAAADPLTAELLGAANTIVGCLNEQNVETYAMITSDEYRGELFGLDEPLSAEAYAEFASTLPNIDHRIVELGDVAIVDDTTVTATVTYVTSYQQRTGTWTFIQREVDGLQAWVLDREEPVVPVAPEGAEEVTIEIADNRYTLSSESIAAPDVVFSLANADDVDHEALVLQFGDGTTTDDLLRSPGPSLPPGVTLIGQATIPAGAGGTMVLADLPPGIYTIVCLLPDEEGLPHLASGMATEFTVE